MEIRPGTLSDVAAVRALIVALTVARSDIVTTGFVEYPLPSEEVFNERCTHNPFFLVAEDGNDLVGFFLGFTSERLAQRNDLSVAEQHIFSLSNHFVYGELFGILPVLQQQGLVQDLFDKVFAKMQEEGYEQIFGCVAHAPLANFACIKLMERMGQELVAEIVDQNELVFGIYKKML